MNLTDGDKNYMGQAVFHILEHAARILGRSFHGFAYLQTVPEHFQFETPCRRLAFCLSQRHHTLVTGMEELLCLPDFPQKMKL